MYLRKSQMDRDFDDVSVEETLNRHRKRLTEFVTRQKIHVSEILEEVVSGESLSARPQMMKCLELINTGKYAGVICMDIDRLSRGSSLDSGYIMQVLQVNHCKIITPGKTYDLDQESDEQFTDMKFLFSRYELKTINKRLMRGREQSAKEGKFIGWLAPYGYDVVKLQGIKGNTLKPNPQEAPVVKMIFDLYVHDRLGFIQISHKLNELGIKTKKGQEWSQQCVLNVINNITYTGKIRWGRYVEDKQIKDGKLIKTRHHEKNYEVYDGLHEALITDDLYQEAQRIRSSKAIPPNRHSTVLQNPFAGILVCANCGKRIIRKSYPNKNTPDRFTCTNPNCPGKSIQAFEVENAVVEQMKQWLNNYIVKMKNDSPKPGNDLTGLLNGLQDHLKEIKSQQNKICDLLEQGIYTVDLFTTRNGVLQDDIEKTECAIKELTVQIQKQESQKSETDQMIPTAQKLLGNYDHLTPTEKNIMWKAVLEKITFFRPETGGTFEVTIYPKLPKL